MSNIFCISDTHFGQEEIIQYNDRPFKNAKDMFEKIKSNWNSVVGSGDTVYHVGDFSAGKVNIVHIPVNCFPNLTERCIS